MPDTTTDTMTPLESFVSNLNEELLTSVAKSVDVTDPATSNTLIDLTDPITTLESMFAAYQLAHASYSQDDDSERPEIAAIRKDILSDSDARNETLDTFGMLVDNVRTFTSETPRCAASLVNLLQEALAIAEDQFDAAVESEIAAQGLNLPTGNVTEDVLVKADTSWLNRLQTVFSMARQFGVDVSLFPVKTLKSGDVVPDVPGLKRGRRGGKKNLANVVTGHHEWYADDEKLDTVIVSQVASTLGVEYAPFRRAAWDAGYGKDKEGTFEHEGWTVKFVQVMDE